MLFVSWLGRGRGGIAARGSEEMAWSNMSNPLMGCWLWWDNAVSNMGTSFVAVDNKGASKDISKSSLSMSIWDSSEAVSSWLGVMSSF